MQNVWVLASLWVGLALVATLLAIWFKISTALTEIVVRTVAQLVVGVFVAQGGLGAKSDWITFLAGTGAIVLRSEKNAIHWPSGDHCGERSCPDCVNWVRLPPAVR